MKEDDGIKVDCVFETEYSEIIKNPIVLHYDYGLPEDEISIIDYLPTSAIQTDLKFEELTNSCSLELDQQDEQAVNIEKTEPCAAAQAIEANIPTPNASALSKWRTFISAAYYHPNILAHMDVSDLKELFQLLGTDINFKSVNVMIDLGKTVKEYKPVPYLRPMLPSSQKPPLFNFAHVKDFFIDMELKVCIVKSYGINDSMKKAVNEMVTFIIEYPEALYLEIYGFILDFLLKFGVQSDVIIDAVMRTQSRRRKYQKPASVLILRKANRLGKGKKEFLQRKLLETPEQKYHPIVPVISEPTPVRNLRNRTTGGFRTDCTSDTAKAIPLPPSDSNHSQQLPMPDVEKPSNISSTSSPTVFAVKRKLFVDESQNDLKLKKNETPNLRAVVSTQKIHSFAGNPLGSRKKRFYCRRDSSTIEKPFTCSICPERSFAYKGNLVLHMKKKHQYSSSEKVRPKRQENEVPAFSCPVCLQGYASKYRCRTHMDRHHPDHGDWDPISNLDCTSRLKKTVTKAKRKLSGNKSSKEVIRRNTRQSVVPLSETQNSTSQHEKTSQFCFNSKRNYFSDNFVSQKQQLNIHIGNTVSVAYKELPYSTLNHRARTRQQFRAAIK